MERDSLIMLAKSCPRKDHEMAERLGVPMPQRDVLYTVSEGPFLMYCYIQKKSTLAIRIEELGKACYDPSFFIEVQPPMKIDLNQILIS